MNLPGASDRPLSRSAQRVQDTLRAGGFGNRVIELVEPVKTAQAAADAVGCTAAQIVKSLLFRCTGSGRGVLVVASGANRVDTARLAALVGEPVVMGEPRFVRETTGFAIGGIPPVGHAVTLDVFIDAHLMTFESLWAAAGHPNSLFPLTPAELASMTRGRIAEVV